MEATLQNGSLDSSQQQTSEPEQSVVDASQERALQLSGEMQQIRKYRQRAQRRRNPTTAVIEGANANLLETQAQVAHALLSTTDDRPWSPEDVDRVSGAIDLQIRLNKLITQAVHLDQLARRKSAREVRENIRPIATK